MLRARRLNIVSGLIVALGTMVVLGLGGYWLHLRQQATAGAPDETWPQAGGTLIICGGGGVPDEVRDQFVRSAGGGQARIVVLPAYSPRAEERARLARFWQDCGVAATTVVSAATRADADSPALRDVLAEATGVWIGGGNQKRLADSYVDTEVERQLLALLDRGGVVGGISAGAAVMTRVMIAEGHDAAREERGFDLLPHAVVDQHFFRRNRTQRLLGVLANHSNLIGLGIDEHTAVVVRRQTGRWNVIGQSYVMICLPRDDMFPRIEILKPGETTDIEVLKELPGTTAINSPTFLDQVLQADSLW